MNREEPEMMLSHIELINATIATPQCIHQENKENKMVISLLTKGLCAKNSGNGRTLQPFVTAHPQPQVARPPDTKQQDPIENDSLLENIFIKKRKMSDNECQQEVCPIVNANKSTMNVKALEVTASHSSHNEEAQAAQLSNKQ